MLHILDLSVSIDDTPIISSLSLSVQPSDVHAIMGPNGSGKSTLSYALMGHPRYTISHGTIEFNGERITDLSPDKRARRGLFLAFQYPHEVEGVRFLDLLRQSYNALYGGTDKQLGVRAFRTYVQEKMDLLGIPHSAMEREVNVGFSGGEKKRAEMLQLAVLQPKLAILDEIDSGLDIDALKQVAEGINAIRRIAPDMSVIMITHYQRILNYVKPHHVHVMSQGNIVRSGGPELATQLELVGYDQLPDRQGVQHPHSLDR